jgi:drug/metabolite transporter (DMT)-like permease
VTAQPPPPSERRRTALRASLLLATSAALWGLFTVATKGLVARAPPLLVLVVQLLGSVVFLWAAVLVTRAPLRLDRGAALASLSGLLEPGLAYTFGIIGLALTTASNASLIGAAETPLIVLLSWLFLGERFGARTLALAVLAGAGVGLLVLPDLQGLASGSILGDLLVGLATLLAAIYVTVCRRLVAGIAPLPLAALQQTVGLAWALAVLVAGRAAGWAPAAPADLSTVTVLLVGASGVLGYALTFWLYLAGLRHLPASRAALFLALIPVFGVAGAALLLGERLVLAQWAGAVVVVGAVGAMVRSEHGRTAEPATRHLRHPRRRGATSP